MRKLRGLIILFCCIYMFSSCNFINSFTEEDTLDITSLSLSKTKLNVSVGEISYIPVSIKPAELQKDVNLNWTFDKNIINVDASSWGATITGVKEGQTTLKCSYSGYEATCVINVSGYTDNYKESIEPYIYSNTTIMQIAPGVTEKISCSLYGGTAADIDGYTWVSENTNVAKIEPTGQYCLITAKDTGYTRIKVTHSKATYPYYIGVYVFSDITKVCYITTSTNIITTNLENGEQTISVNLINGSTEFSDSLFSWEIIDNSDAPIKYEAIGNKAVITPIKAGSCTLRVMHPESQYPLDILCRVISIIKNVYIEPDVASITLSGEDEKTVSVELKNIDKSEYDIDGFTYTLDDYNVAQIVGFVGNKVILKGKANGACKLIISHDNAKYAREVLLIVNGQLTNAIDSSFYITTNQNYIRTKVGADSTKVLISLKGGIDGDEKDFTWSVKSTTNDNTENDVIALSTTHGKSLYTRAASFSYTYGEAYIEPKYEGTAVITITHPKIVYPTEILIKVLGKDAILEEPLYFTGEGLIRVLNNFSTEYEVQLRGSNKNASDDNNIQWNCDNENISITPSGNIANIVAPPKGTGNTISNLTISHSKADADKKVLILTADTEEELNNMKVLYSDKLYYNIDIDDVAYCMTNYVGFDFYETKTDEKGDEYKQLVEYDFSTAVWTVSNSSICSIEKDKEYPLNCRVVGLKPGKAIVTISVTDEENKKYTCSYEITVYPEGAIQTEEEVYFTTSQNVVNLASCGDEKTVNVTAINLLTSKYSEITWTVENEEVVSVKPNGTTATITALTEGETIVYVTHEDSQNTLKIYVRVGSEYEIHDAEPIVYISSNDVITMLKDDEIQRLDAVLVNYAGVDNTGFSFTIDNEEVAVITSQSKNGIAYIKPIGSGQAEIIICHTATTYTKKVLVVVGNSAEELAGFTYLTTDTNVVAIGEGNTKSVSVTVKNSEEIIIDGYTWTSSNSNIVSVNDSGSTAVLSGNSIGTVKITVTNKNCKYPLEIIVQVVDPIAAAANPFIQLTSSVLTLNVNSSYSSITADLIGGTEADFSDFVWTSNDTSVVAIYGQNEVGKLKALKEGTAYITVSHPKAILPAQILVVCDKVIESDCHISVPSSIINMKPTDSAQTITANLINGSDTDKYNFSWSLDVYDVIDFVYSANVCTIEPKQQGQATITIRHPKSEYDQQIIVTVQEYTNFAFPEEYTTLTQGTVSFKTMQIPTTRVSTYVEYSVDNSDICSVSGTKTTAQITAVSPGTTNVRAKLIASSTGTVQASAEMMVYVKQAPVDACFITSYSTIYTIQKDKSQTLSANITGSGILTSDQQNLQWSTNDTDIVNIAGINTNGKVTGQSIYITAKNPGEALITCSHEKAASDLQFYVIVPGTGEKVITLNKNHITLIKGSSGSTLTAKIENAESSNDYNNLIWDVVNVGENEVCRLMGSGQNVTIYPVNPGEADVIAQLPNSTSVAKCTVIVEAGKSFTFESSAAKVQPYETKKFKYIVSPANANLTWTMNQSDDFFTYRDLGCDENGVGYVEIEGIKDGSGNLYCVTDGNAKGTLKVRVAWDYEFSLTGKTMFSINPTEVAEIGYKVNPSYSEITISSVDEKYFTCNKTDNGDGTGKLVITPISECANTINIIVTATNPNNGEVVGSKNISANIRYDELHPTISMISKDGKYSTYDSVNKILKLGDGETVQLKFGIQEKQATGKVSQVRFIAKDTEKDYAKDTFISSSMLYELSDMQEDKIVTTNQYRISNLYVPFKISNNIKTYVNWKTELSWRAYYKTVGFWNDEYDDYFGIAQLNCYADGTPPNATNFWQGYYFENSTYTPNSNWYKEEDESYRNTVMTEAEFCNYAWLYCPGTPKVSKKDLWVSYADYVKGDLVLGSYGEGAKVTIEPHIMTENVIAEFEVANSTDESIKEEYLIGQIETLIEHLGSNQPKVTSISVYYSIRDCPKK